MFAIFLDFLLLEVFPDRELIGKITFSNETITDGLAVDLMFENGKHVLFPLIKRVKKRDREERQLSNQLRRLCVFNSLYWGFSRFPQTMSHFWRVINIIHKQQRARRLRRGLEELQLIVENPSEGVFQQREPFFSCHASTKLLQEVWKEIGGCVKDV